VVYEVAAVALCYTGALADAERLAQKAVDALQGNQNAEADAENPASASQALAIVLLRLGRYEEGMALASGAWLEASGTSFFKSIVLSEVVTAALRQGDTARAQAIAEQIQADDEELGEVYSQAQAMTIQGVIAEALGEREMAHDLLSNALVIAREARLIELEASLAIQLAGWSVHGNLMGAARRYADDALQITAHEQLRLLQADALNLLSSIERSFGNQHEAASAATEAYRLAWCDGPPFSYDWGIRQARENLAAVGEMEPEDMPPPIATEEGRGTSAQRRDEN
jgi:ATP/maltotriose-dependent transcriptional regulator MalT